MLSAVLGKPARTDTLPYLVPRQDAPAPGSLDTVLCLSVTKWVHLHRGDPGLAALFARVAAALSPGGVLVLEPQPWRSYQAAVGKLRRAVRALPAQPGLPWTATLDGLPQHKACA